MKLPRPRYAARITLYYVIVASLWILFSDRLLAWLFIDPITLSNVQTFKGLGFIVVSGLTIFFLLRTHAARQSRAETQLRQLSRAVEQSANAIIITDTDGNIEYVNPRFTQLTGYTHDEVLGENPRILKSGTKSTEEYAELWETITSGHDWRGNLYNKRKGGGHYWASATISPIRDAAGRITHFVGVQEDVTERKHAEEKLEQRNRELTLLNRVISAAASSLHAEEVLSVTCREIALTFGVPQVAVLLRNEDGRTVDVVAEYGLIEPEAGSGVGLKIPIEGNTALECIMVNGEPCAFADVQQELSFAPAREVMARRGVASVLFVPLLVRDELVGLIELDAAEKREFGDEEIALAMNVANAVSQALDNARLYERVSRHNDVLIRAVAQRTEELQRVKDRVEAILNNSPDAILLIQPDGRIETANPTFSQLFGIDGDVYDYPVSQFVQPEDAPLLRRALGTALGEDRVTRIEVTALATDGKTFDAGIALAAFEETDKQRLVCVVRDITALKEVERMKDAFVSNVSHELRTPITSLKLHHHLLRLNPDKSAIYMDRLEREIARLSHIIEDLLTLSRMDQDRLPLELEPLDLNRLLAQYVADRALLADEHGLDIEYDAAAELPLMEADRGLIGQVFSILLTNALNYTPKGGQVKVRALHRDVGGECWVGFSVSDTGYGIPAEEQQHVFDRFFRGEVAKETNSPGTGLGLAIAREIVERHQGWIEVTSSGVPGEGATFRVWLPALGRKPVSG